MSNGSEVSICNQAISWLGGNLLLSLADNTTEGRLCAANYAILRDAVLEAAPWTFAQRRVVLTPLAAIPAWGYSTQFLLPGDVLHVEYCGRSGRWEEDDSIDDWQKEQSQDGQNVIVCNQSIVYARYTQRVTDVKLMSTLFTQALAARLAMDLATPITNSRSMLQSMAEMFAGKMREAAAQDGKQGRMRRITGNILMNARRAGGTSWGSPTV